MARIGLFEGADGDGSSLLGAEVVSSSLEKFDEEIIGFSDGGKGAGVVGY